MSMIPALRRVSNQLLGSLGVKRRDQDLTEELESHVRHLTEEYIRRGASPEEARRRARIEFGGLEAAKEDYRDQRSLPLLDITIQDVRYALRGIVKNPGFAAVTILSLAIGIGATTAIFSILNSVILQPLAYSDPNRVFAVRELSFNARGQSSLTPVNPRHAREWASLCPSLEQVALMRATTANVLSAGDPISVQGVDVPHNLLALLGVEPLLGRTFLTEEEQAGASRAVILSESFWRSRFQSDRSIIGRAILVDGQNHLVVGVIPSLQLPYAGMTGIRFAIFRPLVLSTEELSRLMGNFNYAAIVRIKHGVTVDQATAEINVVQSRFPAQLGRKEKLEASLISAHELVSGRARLGLWVLAAAIGAVLLIVCINLANLLLSRNASRSREAAIRIALGAGRGRQFRMALTENLLLAISGGVLGTALAQVGIQLIAAMTTLNIPRLDEVHMDSTVLIFAVCITVLTGVLFGALPAWRLTRNDPQEALRAGSHTVTEGRSGQRLRQSLITFEVALSAGLLIVAGLLAGSFMRLLRVDKGFEAGRVLTVDVRLAGDLYADTKNRERFFNSALADLSKTPGVQTAGMVTFLPTLGNSWNDSIYLEGAPREKRYPVDNRYASPGYFPVMKIPILIGRAFEESDRGRGVAILSVKAINLLWPGDPNPVGRMFMGEDDKIKTLVGIAGEVRAELQTQPPPMAYYPYWQRVPDDASLVIRTSGDPRPAIAAIRSTLRRADPQLPVQSIQPLEEVVDRSVTVRRFQMTLIAVFAGAALLVASLGIYGVVSYSVARRRSEISIRMALGARRSALLALIIRQGMTPVILGLLAGLTLSMWIARAIRGLLFEVQPSDPLVIAAVVAVLLTVGLLACLIPAGRAANTDPVKALRFE